MVNIVPRKVAETPAQPSRLQTLTWGLDRSQVGQKAKGKKCTVRSPCEIWCTAGSDLPLGILQSDSHIQPAAPGVGPVTLRGDHGLQGGGIPCPCRLLGRLRMPRASHSPCRAKPWDFWAVFNASLNAGAVGL